MQVEIACDISCEGAIVGQVRGEVVVGGDL